MRSGDCDRRAHRGGVRAGCGVRRTLSARSSAVDRRLNIDHGLDVDRGLDVDGLDGACVLAAARLFQACECPGTMMIGPCMVARHLVDCHRMMRNGVVLSTREQDTPFQVFEHHRQGDPSPLGSTTRRIGGNLDQHGPSWAKRPLREVPPYALPCMRGWHRRRERTFDWEESVGFLDSLRKNRDGQLRF